MTIGDICNREVIYATRDTTVHAAAKLMRRHHVGTLVIVDERDGARIPAGIVTDRDIVVEVDAVEIDPRSITVGDMMSAEVVTIAESAGLLEAMQLMRFRGVRRLPVTGREGQLVGIVSTDDVLEILAEGVADLARVVAHEQAHEARARR